MEKVSLYQGLSNEMSIEFILGQFICSEKRCEEKEHLRSWEVLFGYVEHGKNVML